MSDQTAAPTQQDKVDIGHVPIHLSMNVSTVEYLLRVLDQQPYGEVANLIAGLRQAATEQVRAYLDTVPPTDAATDAAN